MEWYYADNGESLGPVSEDEFAVLVSSGKVTDSTMVWKEGMADWLAYGVVNDENADTAEQAAGVGDKQEQKGDVVARSEPVAASSSELSGNTPNSELTAMARASLKGSWGTAIGISIIGCIVMGAAQWVPFLVLAIAGPISVGFAVCFLSLARGVEPDIGQLFDGFKNFLSSFVAYLMMSIFIFLWSLLFIIPGIIAAYAYSQVFFVIADDPSISGMDALKRSKLMMRGKKWKYFCLSLRFVGWSILCIFTLGLGYIWLMPYMSTCMAQFYRDVSQRAIEV